MSEKQSGSGGKMKAEKGRTLSALFLRSHFCARDWIRTSTSLRTLRPEHSASTNFATRAVMILCSGAAKVMGIVETCKSIRLHFLHSF
jgi:hypothetical protein